MRVNVRAEISDYLYTVRLIGIRSVVNFVEVLMVMDEAQSIGTQGGVCKLLLFDCS